jgi:hypothetical protein
VRPWTRPRLPAFARRYSVRAISSIRSVCLLVPVVSTSSTTSGPSRARFPVAVRLVDRQEYGVASSRSVDRMMHLSRRPSHPLIRRPKTRKLTAEENRSSRASRLLSRRAGRAITHQSSERGSNARRPRPFDASGQEFVSPWKRRRPPRGAASWVPVLKGAGISVVAKAASCRASTFRAPRAKP